MTLWFSVKDSIIHYYGFISVLCDVIALSMCPFWCIFIKYAEVSALRNYYILWYF